MDITKNPLVALYFAIESTLDHTGVVFVITDHSNIVDVLEDFELNNEYEFQNLMRDIFNNQFCFIPIVGINNQELKIITRKC